MDNEMEDNEVEGFEEERPNSGEEVLKKDEAQL